MDSLQNRGVQAALTYTLLDNLNEGTVSFQGWDNNLVDVPLITTTGTHTKIFDLVKDDDAQHSKIKDFLGLHGDYSHASYYETTVKDFKIRLASSTYPEHVYENVPAMKLAYNLIPLGLYVRVSSTTGGTLLN